MFVRLLFLMFVAGNVGLYIYNRENQPKTIKFQATDEGVEKLVLLEELEKESTIWEDTSNKNEETEADILNQQCYSLGPFETKASMQTTMDALKTEVLKVRSRELVSSQEAGYWVFIPALQTREEALAVARRLAEAQVKDYYVVTTGDRENTLSLGVYRDSDNATSRVNQIRSRGFQAEKEVRIEQWPEFWLDYVIVAEKEEIIASSILTGMEVAPNLVECNW